MSHQGILLTGFNPFHTMDRNPSQAVVEAISGRPGFDDVVVDVLPTEFDAAEKRVIHLLTHHRPAVWIGVGLNQRATAIQLEQVAVNLDDARIPDNSGDQRQNRQIDPAGPGSYPSRLPLNAIQTKLSEMGIAVERSDSAGRFVCNHVFYTACRAADRLSLPIRCGFIHVPWPEEWGSTSAGVGAMPIEVIIDAIATAVAACR